MNYNKTPITQFFLYALFVLLAAPAFANGVWDGGGDGTSWDDPLNWGDDLEPVATDDVVIPAATTIQVRMAGEVAESITFTDATSILAVISGDLTVDQGTIGDLIDMPLGGTINISSGAMLRLQNGDNGIDANNGATVNNGGQLIFENLDSEALDISGAPLLLTNQAGGTIQGIAPFDIDFIDIAGSAAGTVITNSGTIRVDMNDVGSDFLDVNGQTAIRNEVGGLIDLEDIDDNVFELGASGTTFDNFGTIDVFESGDECFELNDGTRFTNHSSGILRTSEVEDEVFEIEDAMVLNEGTIEVNNIVGTGSVQGTDEVVDILNSNGRFTNNGTITITGVEDQGIIEVDLGVFTNNNVINMGMGFPSAVITDEAIDLDDGGDARFVNTKCAIVNITSTNPIEIGALGQLTNDGILTTVFTGINEIDGIFLNNGLVASPNGIFNSSPNGLTGSGKLEGAPIPATVSLCNMEPIPTMSQWGLFIFALLVLNMSIFFLRRSASILA
ncbi:MAG: hypothetical protein AAGJ18_13700 [Bacteroidota bacterium]